MSTEVASGAYDAFMFGTLEQRGRLVNFVFSNLELKGLTLCYSSPLEKTGFVNTSNIEEWRARRDSNPQPLDP